jgi:ATP-dependent Clp protease ATP-binding subunit ClpA
MMTKIPLDKLTQTEVGRLSNLETILKSHIVGQDEAVSEVAKAIRRSRAGLHNPKRPLGSFIFLGPTGVGKTETAKVIAREVFQDPDALIRVDMSEFMERHNVSRLVGAPAGYVGYEEGGKLTEAVRRKPYAVVLFDEIEKANPDVFNILLQVLEDGILTDAQGKTVNFRNTIIIMTSNLGMQELTREAAKIGFADREAEKSATPKPAELEEQYSRIKSGVLEQVKQYFKPEFVNRIDKILVFKPLGIQELRKIASLQLLEIAARLKEQGVILRTSPAVAKFVSEQSFDPLQGARFIRKNIETLLEDPLAEKIIQSHLGPGSTIVAGVDKGAITFDIEKSKQKVPVAA